MTTHPDVLLHLSTANQGNMVGEHDAPDEPVEVDQQAQGEPAVLAAGIDGNLEGLLVEVLFHVQLWRQLSQQAIQLLEALVQLSSRLGKLGIQLQQPVIRVWVILGGVLLDRAADQQELPHTDYLRTSCLNASSLPDPCGVVGMKRQLDLAAQCSQAINGHVALPSC